MIVAPFYWDFLPFFVIPHKCSYFQEYALGFQLPEIVSDPRVPFSISNQCQIFGQNLHCNFPVEQSTNNDDLVKLKTLVMLMIVTGDTCIIYKELLPSFLFSRPEPTSHFTCGIAAIMKWRKTNGIYLVVSLSNRCNSKNAT